MIAAAIAGALEQAGAADRKKVADAIRAMDTREGPAKYFPGGRVKGSRIRRKSDAHSWTDDHRPYMTSVAWTVKPSLRYSSTAAGLSPWLPNMSFIALACATICSLLILMNAFCG